jgi:hypothetical protein
MSRDFAAMTSSTPRSPRADADHIGVTRTEVRDDQGIAAIAACANRGIGDVDTEHACKESADRPDVLAGGNDV